MPRLPSPAGADAPSGAIPTPAAPAAASAPTAQRRAHVRLRSSGGALPVAQLRHPMIPDMRLQLAVVDLSAGGCALAMPDDLPPIDPGVLINDVQLQLDARVHVAVSLRLLHITSIDPDSNALRLGCAFDGELAPGDLDALAAHLAGGAAVAHDAA